MCSFFFVFSSRTDRFFNLSCHLFSYPLSLKQTSSFTKIIFFVWIFSKNKREGKNHLFLLCLCRSRQILGYVCRPIKGSQLALYVQMRLVCKVLSVNTFLRIIFFFTMCDLSPLNFPALKCYRTGVRCYICNLCCTYGSGCLYIILCRTALNICDIHLRSNNRDNICLYCLQLRLLDTSFFCCFFFFVAQILR